MLTVITVIFSAVNSFEILLTIDQRDYESHDNQTKQKTSRQPQATIHVSCKSFQAKYNFVLNT